MLPCPPSADGIAFLAFLSASLDGNDIAEATVRRSFHEGKGLQAEVCGIDFILGREQNDVTSCAEEEAVERAVGCNHGTREAEVAQRHICSGHRCNSTKCEREGAENVDDRVDKEGWVVVQSKLVGRVGVIVGLVRAFGLSLTTNREEDEDV